LEEKPYPYEGVDLFLEGYYETDIVDNYLGNELDELFDISLEDYFDGLLSIFLSDIIFYLHYFRGFMKDPLT